MYKNQNKLIILFHIVIFTIHVTSLLHSIYRKITLEALGLLPAHLTSNGWIFKYFTYWTQLVHIMTYGVSLLCDFCSANQKTSSILRLRNLLFNRLALPMAFFVCTMYWPIFAMNRTIVLPKGSEELQSFIKNHVRHTMPAFVVLIDNFLVDHKRRQDKNGVKLLWTVVLAFACYIAFIGYFRNDWVYPLLAKVNHIVKLFILLGVVATETAYYHLGGLLYDLAW